MHEHHRIRAALRITWVVMLACQVALFLIHPHLDRLLDGDQRTVVEHVRFYAIHRVYLLVTTAQWTTGIVHFILALLDWRAEDREVRSSTLQAGE